MSCSVCSFAVDLVGELSRRTFGNSQMQNLCLHSLVRLISSMDNTEAVRNLTILFELKMVPLISCCLRNDDSMKPFNNNIVELVSWAIFLMHEFIIKDVGRKEFCELKGLLRVLLMLLSEESCIPRIILRSLKCLGMNNEAFQLEMISNQVVKSTIPFIKSQDEEAQYWALSLLHDLMGFGESHKEFLDNNGLKVVNEVCLIENPSVHVALFIADILVSLCGSSANHEAIIAGFVGDGKGGILETVMVFCGMSDHDVQYGGLALFLNLAAISDALIGEMIEGGVLEIVTDLLLDSSAESIQIVCAKTLVVISKKSIWCI